MVQRCLSVQTYRSLLLVFVTVAGLAACDLQPSPKSTGPSPAGTPETAPPKDASVPPDALVVTAGCRDVAVHVANVLINGAADPALRATYESARAKMIQTMSEACTTRGWSSETQRCYLSSKNEVEARACERTVTPPVAPSAPNQPQ